MIWNLQPTISRISDHSSSYEEFLEFKIWRRSGARLSGSAPLSAKKTDEMKVLLLNGSPHREGNTYLALHEVAGALQEEGIETIEEWIGTKAVQGCIACYKCYELGRCVFHDDLYERLFALLPEIDGIVIGSPTYYAGPNGSLCAILDRLFYSGGRYLAYKPGAAVAVARRGGASSTFERLNKYFTILNMPQVPSQYWNMAYGREPGEVLKDGEGMQTMRTLGRNMAWLLKKLHASEPVHPEPSEARIATNFIR